MKASEKTEEQEGDKDGNRRAQPTPTQPQDKDGKKKQPKQKDLEEEFEQSRIQACKEEEERLQKQVTLLINPPQLYDEKVRINISRRHKKYKQGKGSSGTSIVEPLLEDGEGKKEESGPIVAAQDQNLSRRSVWSLFRHRNENATKDKEDV